MRDYTGRSIRFLTDHPMVGIIMLGMYALGIISMLPFGIGMPSGPATVISATVGASAAVLGGLWVAKSSSLREEGALSRSIASSIMEVVGRSLALGKAYEESADLPELPVDFWPAINRGIQDADAFASAASEHLLAIKPLANRLQPHKQWCLTTANKALASMRETLVACNEEFKSPAARPSPRLVARLADDRKVLVQMASVVCPISLLRADD